MQNRKEILGALRRCRPFVGNIPEEARGERFFADYPAPEKLYDCFSERLTALRGECYAVFSRREAAEKLLTLVADPEKRVVYSESAIFTTLLRAHAGLSERLAECALSRQTDISNAGMARVDIGLTGADFLIARTGSVVLRASAQGGRRLSVLPEFHIVFAMETQLVASLEGCLPDLKIDPQWSSAVIISGPSRTSDIEKTLVLGAHGPKRLAVVVERDRQF